MNSQNQVKSKKRVADHGEVFTSEREINAMLNMVQSETERIDSRFLEPACGTGNFLMEVLRRKTDIVFNTYRKSQIECEKYNIVAIGSIYGVDLLKDNVVECRYRLFEFFKKKYYKHYKIDNSHEYLNVIKFILSKNIVCGDALTMKDYEEKPIIFSEWSSVYDNMIKRRDFSFSQLLETSNEQTSLFDAGWSNDDKRAEYIPNPVKEFPAIHYRQLIRND